MGNKVRINARKQRTLADVRQKYANGRKTSKAAKDFAKSMQIDIANELKAIRTQAQLTNIKDLVEAYGSEQNRADFKKLNSAFAKEARVLIDTELATITSKEQLESIRSMVELNGSAEQKARFAEFESYYTKPTWEKYAKLHGGNYAPLTSGVAENDRIAEEIIHRNNMKEFEAAAREADKAAKQAEKELAANAEMRAFLEEGDKLIADGKKVKVQTNPAVLSPSGGAQGAGSVSGAGSNAGRVTGAGNVAGSQSSRIVIPPSGSAKGAGNAANNGGKAVVTNLSKYSKFFKRGFAAAAIGTAAILAGCAAWKVGSELGKYAGRKKSDSDNDFNSVATQVSQPTASKSNQPQTVQPEVKTETKPNAIVQPPVEAEKPADAAKVNDNTTVTKTDKVKPASETAGVKQVTTDTDVSPKTEKTPVILTGEEVVREIKECFGKGKNPKDDGVIRFYIVQKGDCVWNFAKEYLRKHNDMRLIVRQLVMGDRCNEPSENAIILRFTKDICDMSGIRYIIDDKKLMPKDTLFLPEYEAA